MRNDKVSGEGPARLSTRLERRMQFVLGPKPADWQLKDALLGKDRTGNRP